MTPRNTRCTAQWRGARCILLTGHAEAHRATWEDGESDEFAPAAGLTADLLAALVASRHQLVVVSSVVAQPEHRARIARAIRLGDAALARAEREASAYERQRRACAADHGDGEAPVRNGARCADPAAPEPRPATGPPPRDPP